MKLLRYRPSVPNFGDDLNDLLWPALVPGLFEGGGGADPDIAAFVGIGTIVGIDPGASRRLHVFSSGAGYSTADRWTGLEVQYHCVRGPVTARALGLAPELVLTDGAILAPLLDRFHKPAGRGGRARTVVVPHYETIADPGWTQAARMAGFDLVDPRGTPEQVIAALAAARLVLTESLHGAILADALGVPWRGFAVSRNFSTAKWADWTGSLNLAVDITLVPPPDAMPLLRFGKREEPFGSALSLDPERALREFRTRVAAPRPVPWLKTQAKRFLERVPAGRRLLGFNPERTAEALSQLAAGAPNLSSARKREALRDEMLSRLSQLAHRQGKALGVLV